MQPGQPLVIAHGCQERDLRKRKEREKKGRRREWVRRDGKRFPAGLGDP